MHAIGAERVAGDGGHQRGVDAARQAQDHAGKAVLVDVVAQAGDQRAVDLGNVGGRGRDGGGNSGPIGGGGGVDHEGIGARAGRQVEIRNEDLVDELGTTGDERAVGPDDQGVAVEDEFVLAADHVDVGEGEVAFSRAVAAKVQAHVVLIAFIRRAVDHDQKPAPARLRDRAAVLPQVLADRQRNVDAANPQHAGLLARHEVTELVEDAVVGQMVLAVASDELPAMQDARSVDRGATRSAEPIGRTRQAVEVADDHDDLAEAIGRKIAREPFGSGARGSLERRSQGEVLDGIAGEEHLGQGHDVGAQCGGPRDRLPRPRAIARQVSHGGVRLGQRHAQDRHAPSVRDPSWRPDSA